MPAAQLGPDLLYSLARGLQLFGGVENVGARQSQNLAENDFLTVGECFEKGLHRRRRDERGMAELDAVFGLVGVEEGFLDLDVFFGLGLDQGGLLGLGALLDHPLVDLVLLLLHVRDEVFVEHELVAGVAGEAQLLEGLVGPAREAVEGRLVAAGLGDLLQRQFLHAAVAHQAVAAALALQGVEGHLRADGAGAVVSVLGVGRLEHVQINSGQLRRALLGVHLFSRTHQFTRHKAFRQSY